MLNATTTLSLFSSSWLRLRHALLIPHFTLPSSSRLYSHSLPQPRHHQASAFHNVDDVLASFNHMFCTSPAPPIMEFGKILGSLVKMKHSPTAISLSKQLERRGIAPNIVTSSILVNCYCHLGQMAVAFFVLAKILKMGYQPNAITLTTLMKGLCFNGEIEKALHLHDSVIAEGFKLNEFSYRQLSFRC